MKINLLISQQSYNPLNSMTLNDKYVYILYPTTPGNFNLTGYPTIYLTYEDYVCINGDSTKNISFSASCTLYTLRKFQHIFKFTSLSANSNITIDCAEPDIYYRQFMLMPKVNSTPSNDDVSIEHQTNNSNLLKVKRRSAYLYDQKTIQFVSTTQKLKIYNANTSIPFDVAIISFPDKHERIALPYNVYIPTKIEI